jgi:hypothetical protein
LSRQSCIGTLHRMTIAWKENLAYAKTIIDTGLG